VLRSMAARIDTMGDVWADMQGQPLAPAITRLEALT
jgi:hypothetical protein